MEFEFVAFAPAPGPINIDLFEESAFLPAPLPINIESLVLMDVWPAGIL